MLRFRTCCALVGVMLVGAIGCVTTQSSSQSNTQSSSASSSKQTEAQAAPCATKLSKIKEGMSEKEVHELLGRPGYVYYRPSGKSFIPFYNGSDYTHSMEGYKGEGRVEFDSDHNVAGVECDAAELGHQ